MRAEIVVIGSLNVDYVVRVKRFPSPGETVSGMDFTLFAGGKGANQAFAAARLGASVAIVGQLGNDAAADTQIAHLRSAGVNVDFVARDPAVPTGAAIVAVDDSGENRIVVIAGANGTFQPESLRPAQACIDRARIVLLQLEIPWPTVAAAMRAAKRGGAKVILDPAPVQPLARDPLSDIDYLTPNLQELGRLTKARLAAKPALPSVAGAARRLCRRGARQVIVKLGPRGALLVSAEAQEHWPGFRVAPIDTTAAGDCFNGAFAAALAWGKSERDAGEFANAAAACSVTRAGAQASMPTRAEVELLLKRAKAGRT